jgi:hypothetical protein
VLLNRSSHPNLEVFRIFDEALGLLTERMTSSLKRFRMAESNPSILDEDDDDGSGEAGGAASIKKRHKRENERAERENRENTSAVLELRDMDDELATLIRLFDSQTTTIGTMRRLYEGKDLKPMTANGRVYLDEALQHLEEYRQTAIDMRERVDKTRTDYEKLLEMAQRQAQVEEVRWSRWQAELASYQNLSVMIFTTFTVIFLPLTFFTGLFGMNTQEWGGDNNLPLSKIGAISLPVSFFLIAGSLVAAFSSHVHRRVKAAYRLVRDLARAARRAARRLQPAARRRGRAREKAAAEQAERAARRRARTAKTYDFWDLVRRQRNSEYEIPATNRRELGGAADVPKETWRTRLNRKEEEGE